MASGSQNLTSYQANKWTNLRAFTIGGTSKDVDGTAAVSWSATEILGSSDSTKFYRGDKTWSDTLTAGLNAAYIGITNTDSTTGYGLSLYGGASAGAPSYGIFFGGTNTFGTHGSVTGSWATYFTMNEDTTRGWIFRCGSTNVASISGGGAVQLNGALTLSGDINLKTSSADSPDIIWRYGNTDTEQARIWMGSGGTSKWAPLYRCYASDGTSLYSGNLVLGDGTGASGTWGISITGNAATATKATQDGSGNTITSYYCTLSTSQTITGSKTFNSAILMPSTVGAAATSQPTALSYGRLQCYGTLCINANTDNSGTEYVILTAGHGCSSSVSDGFYVGTSEVGSYLATRIRHTLHVHPPAGAWVEGIRIHAASNGWTTLILCGTDNTGDSNSSANSYSMHAYGGNFYLARNGSSTGSSVFSCLTDNYWRVSTRLYNAVWNDFAEYRRGETTEGGRVVYDTPSGTMKITTERLQAGSRLISDTYGFAVGEADDAHTPIGVGGRVLAYPYQNRKNFKIGDAVCAAPNGTVDIMTREEIREYPDRIIGIVSEIPDYEIWENKLQGGGRGAASVEVRGRIWIYVR